MAVTAKFQADFSSFLTAIDQADLKLADFSKGSQKVESALNRMVDNFSGRKLIQEASLMTIAIEKAGGVATLTASELQTVGNKAAEAAEKMQKLGYDVPAGLQRLADTAKLGEQNTGLLSTATGKLVGLFTIGALAKWTADLFAAAGHLQDISERTDIGVEALQRFSLIAAQSGSSIDAVSTAVFQMGKRLAGGDESAASALRELGLNFDDLRNARPETAFDTIGRALAALDDPFTQSELGAKIFGKSVQELIPVFKHLKDEMGPVITLTQEQVGALDAVGDTWVKFKASIVPATVAIVDNTFHLSEALEFWTLAAGTNEGLATSIDKATKAAAKAAPGFGAMIPPNVPKDWIDLGAKIDADTHLIAEFDKMLEHLHEVTFKLAMDHEKMWREEIDKTLAERNKAVIEGFGQTQDAQQKLSDFIAKQVLSDSDYQIMKIWEVVAEQEKAFKGTEQQRVQFNATVEALANEQTERLKQKVRDEAQAQADALTKAALDEALAQDRLNASLANTAPAAQAAAGGIQQFTNTLVLGVQNLDELNAALHDFYDQFAGNSVGTPGPGGVGTPVGNSAGMPRIAGPRLHDYTGPASAGQPYLIGTGAQPELFIPSTSGTMVPNGAGGGGGPQVIQLVVDGRVLTSIVNDHNTRGMRQGRQFPAA